MPINAKQIVNEAKKLGVEMLIVVKMKDQSPQMATTVRPSELATQIGQALSVIVEALHTEGGQFTRDEILSAVEAAAHAHAQKLLRQPQDSLDIQA